jgi:thiosulfate reductase cytochrome b subunit
VWLIDHEIPVVFEGWEVAERMCHMMLSTSVFYFVMFHRYLCHPGEPGQ